MKGHPIIYSADEMAWLEANRTLPISEYAESFNRTFSRDVAAANLHALRKRKGWKTGRTGKFAKGQEPANKGVPCAPGVGGRHPNAQRTQFKKGHGRSGVAVKLYQPIGTERLSKEGYIQRKIHDGLPLQSRWRGVHMIRWLQKLDDEKRAAAAAAQAEADAKAAEARAAMQDATSAGDFGSMEAAEELFADARKAQADAKRAANDKAQAVGDGRARGLRSYFTPMLADPKAALVHYVSTRPDEVKAFLLTLAKTDVTNGARKIPGFEVVEERRVA